MIAGEHAEAAREDGEALGDAEFGREIRDQRRVLAVVAPAEPVRIAGEVLRKLLESAIEMRQERFVARRGGQPLLIDFAEHPDRIVPGGFPQIAVQPPEELDGIVLPRPTQVVRQLAEFLDRGRQGRDDVEDLDGFHCSLFYTIGGTDGERYTGSPPRRFIGASEERAKRNVRTHFSPRLT